MRTQSQPQGTRMRQIRQVRFVLATVACVALAIPLTFGAVWVATGALSKQPGKVQSRSLGSVTGKKGHATCNEPGQPACPTAPVDWTPVPSLSPAVVLAALEATASFQNPAQVADAPAGSTYAYDTPVLVLPAATGITEDSGYYNLPHYIIRASVNGVRMITYDVVYDPATRELHPSSVGQMLPRDPGYDKPFPWAGVSSSAAVSTLRTSKGLALAPSTVPELVFFAPGPQIYNPNTTWTGGGSDPAHPIWRLHGANGQLYFVGIDGKVYTAQQLPMAAGAILIQA